MKACIGIKVRTSDGRLFDLGEKVEVKSLKDIFTNIVFYFKLVKYKMVRFKEFKNNKK